MSKPLMPLLAVLALAAPCLAASPAAAQDPAPIVDGATLDPAHTSATFWIRHIAAPVAGRFNDAAGRIDIPAKAPDNGKIRFTVKTQSVDTGIAARDKHLRTADFLDTAAHPEMSFESDHITPAGKGIYKVTGKLAIKGVSRTASLPVKYLGAKPHPMMPCVDVAGYETSFSIKRLEYHVGDGRFFKMGAVGDTVDIRIAGETLAPRPDCVKPKQEKE